MATSEEDKATLPEKRLTFDEWWNRLPRNIQSRPSFWYGGKALTAYERQLARTAWRAGQEHAGIEPEDKTYSCQADVEVKQPETAGVGFQYQPGKEN